MATGRLPKLPLTSENQKNQTPKYNAIAVREAQDDF
jgi:hypothetical protein